MTIAGKLGAGAFPATLDDAAGKGWATRDPLRETFGALYRDTVNAELGTLWTTVTAGHSTLAGTNPVQAVYELPPSRDLLQQAKVEFPAVFVHRTGRAEFGEHTLHIDKLTQRWMVHHVLGGLNSADERRFGDMLLDASKVMLWALRNRGHSAHQSGAHPFADVGLLSLRILAREGPGPAALGEEGQTYFATSLELETVELSGDDISGLEDFVGADFTFDVGTADELLDGMIVARTDP